jgi:hypothetical protein
VIVPIVTSLPGRYWARMRIAAIRLLALAALLMMPFGVTGPTMAAAVSAATAEAGHCAEHGKPAEEPVKMQVHCNGCSAIAAIEPPAPVAEFRPRAPRLVTAMHPGTGIEPEIATPPPKLS